MNSPEIQNLAHHLVALETARNGTSAEPGGAGPGGAERGDGAARVIAELRTRLIRFAGVEGFRSLLARALTLAKAEVPALSGAQINAHAALEGLGEAGLGAMEQRQAVGPAGIVLVAHLLALLVTFIGASLTLRLVRDVWPEAALDGADLKTEEKP